MGQCFLKDPRFIERIVETLSPTQGEILLEIGAGEGQLTLPMVDAGARVLAIEADPRLARRLSGKAGAACELIEADAVKVDFDQLFQDRGHERLRGYGNLPYSVAAPILLRLLSYAPRFDTLTLMFQKEVAERLVASPSTKDYSVLSVITQQAADPQILFRIPPEAFRPRPRVVSALVRLDLRHAESPDCGDERTFRSVVKGLLAHRRKTIANNIKHLGPSTVSRDVLARSLAALAIDPSRRAETLSVEEFAEISRICASKS
ncbi:MAG: 16S rRNA (adenine(1518)-N(6)/adenine(1519)-N(6)) -dimethyltransferase RsmA [Acidobacteriota bacterium]|nr:MAG: 16S rRNA (adenine(1518)-N(6)/adenine(1519)-N(6)) -dimethyltransferase RsmA [Acidobacteriota bacterium]